MDIEPEEFERVTQVTYLGFVNGTRVGARAGCCRVTAARSCRSARRWPTGASPCRARTAAPSTPPRASTSRCAPSCCTSAASVRVTMVQMPAVNTPQFSWVLSRLPRQAQPVPPIYQPEVAARAVVYAADHPRRREYWVGETTAATLLVNAVAPGAARPLPRPHRVRRPADADSPSRARPAGEPLGARRRRRRPRLRCARAVRRPGPRPLAPGVGLPAPRAPRRGRPRGTRGRRPDAPTYPRLRVPQPATAGGGRRPSG